MKEAILATFFTIITLIVTTRGESVYKDCATPNHFCFGAAIDWTRLGEDFPAVQTGGCISAKDCNIIVHVSKNAKKDKKGNTRVTTRIATEGEAYVYVGFSKEPPAFTGSDEPGKDHIPKVDYMMKMKTNKVENVAVTSGLNLQSGGTIDFADSRVGYGKGTTTKGHKEGPLNHEKEMVLFTYEFNAKLDDVEINLEKDELIAFAVRRHNTGDKFNRQVVVASPTVILPVVKSTQTGGSKPSDPKTGNELAKPFPWYWILIAFIILIVVIVLVYFLCFRKKKKNEKEPEKGDEAHPTYSTFGQTATGQKNKAGTMTPTPSTAPSKTAAPSTAPSKTPTPSMATARGSVPPSTPTPSKPVASSKPVSPSSLSKAAKSTPAKVSPKAAVKSPKTKK